MKIKQLTCALLLAMGLVANAANEPNTVYQVTEEVTVSENVDYIIAHTTPFVGEGKVKVTYRFTDIYNQQYWTPAFTQ